MPATEVGTAQLPVGDRFAFWCELADSSHVPTILDTEHAASWNATMRIHELGAMAISMQEHPPCTATRNTRLIRRSDPENLYLLYPTSGLMTAAQGDRAVQHGSDSFVVLDTSVPVTVTSPTPTTHLILHVPRPMLPAKHRFEHLLATPIPAHRGLGGVLAVLLRELAFGDATLPAAALQRLTHTVTDLLVAIQLAAAGDAPAMPSESRDHARLVQLHAYIAANLSDPGLTLAQVAGAHRISLRQLDRLFQREGTTPAAWIRDQRLMRCRRDLADPAQNGTPVHQIGGRWGFVDPVTFSRAFSRAYGISPGEYRRRFAGAPPPR